MFIKQVINGKLIIEIVKRCAAIWVIIDDNKFDGRDIRVLILKQTD